MASTCMLFVHVGLLKGSAIAGSDNLKGLSFPGNRGQVPPAYARGPPLGPDIDRCKNNSCVTPGSALLILRL